MHRAAVWALAFSPDGLELYSGDIAGDVHVWNAADGSYRHSIRGHSRPVLDIRFAPAVREVLTASRDGAIGIWSRDTGTRLRTLRPHAAGVFAVAVSASQLFSASYDRTIRATPSGGALLADALSRTSPQALSRTSPQALSRTSPQALSGHTDAVTDLAIVGNRLVSGSRDLTARIWALDTFAPIATRRAHTHWITKVRAAGAAAFVTTSEDGTLAMWDIDADTPRWQRQVNAYSTPVWGLDVSLDGRLAVTGDATGVAKLWDLEAGVERRSLAASRLGNRACAVTGDARRVAVADDDGSLRVFDAATGEGLWRTRGNGRGILSTVVSDDRKTIVCGHADGAIKAQRSDGGAAPAFEGHERFVYQMRRLTPHRFASAGFDGTLAVWNIETGEAVTRCQHGGEIFALAPWNDGKRAATAGGRDACVWDLDTGRLITRLPIRGEGSHSLVAASSDGRTIVATDERGALDTWSLPENARLANHVGAIELELQTDTLSALALTPNGETAVVATAGGTVIVIDLPAMRTRARFDCHEDWIRDLRITQDGRHIVALCQDLALRMLALATGRAVDTGLSALPIAAISLAGDDVVVAVDIDGAVHSAPIR